MRLWSSIPKNSRICVMMLSSRLPASVSSACCAAEPRTSTMPRDTASAYFLNTLHRPSCAGKPAMSRRAPSAQVVPRARRAMRVARKDFLRARDECDVRVGRKVLEIRSDLLHEVPVSRSGGRAPHARTRARGARSLIIPSDSKRMTMLVHASRPGVHQWRGVLTPNRASPGRGRSQGRGVGARRARHRGHAPRRLPAADLYERQRPGDPRLLGGEAELVEEHERLDERRSGSRSVRG